MRDDSSAPRNSHELAVRNQFFTPRYVVEFLTDNTLGRTWYEMHQGETRLRDECHYLVRRPDEVFLAKPKSSAQKAAQNWLQGEEEAEEPDVSTLAETVDPVDRLSAPEVELQEYRDQLIERVNADEASELGTQELLDLLYLTRAYSSEAGVSAWLRSETTEIFEVLRARRAVLLDEDATQEELLNAPVFIRHRPKKDPRDLKILDPACGSGHFLLYAFDLLLTIYGEGWRDENAPVSEATGKSLCEDYPDLDELRTSAPELILEHNLHGIEIDPRAAQIASLALWMRAQRAYNKLSLPRAARPVIKRTNIVVAEPMPGEIDLLREFTSSLQPRLLGQLVETVFEKMELAGEAGSLLKIEQEITEAVAEAKQLWIRGSKAEQLALFDQPQKRKPQQLAIFDLSDITDEDFWDQAETRIYEALHSYAERAENGNTFRRAMFAEDAAEGFSFLDLCRQRYDVVLMNPPFGMPSTGSKKRIERDYPASKTDLYAAFVERGLDHLAPRGLLGAITSRTGLFLSSFEKWRERKLLGQTRPVVFADLGNGVLEAMVETVAYCLEAQ